MARLPRLPLALLGALIPLAACGSTPDGPCPRVGVLSDAAEVASFREGGGRDLGDLIVFGRLTNVASQCDYDEGELEAEVTLTLQAEIGPAAASGKQQLTYFVAVTETDRRVLAKEVFPLAIAFDDARVVTVRDTVEEVTIPLPAGRRGDSYEILVGFELTPEQLAYNRARRAR